MSTIPFVQVEGALALPHIRPLARLPVSFGREWALTVPQFSLRVELRALYAAFMRTMCLSVETFNSVYRWDQHRKPVPRAAVAPAAVAAPVGQDSRSTVKAQPAAATAMASAAMPSTSRAAASVTPESTPPFAHRKLAGGAIAIGGAALLAWIIASHPNNSGPTSTSALRARTDAHDNASDRLADARAEHDRAAGSAAGSAAVTPASLSKLADAKANDTSVREGKVTAGTVESSAPVAVVTPAAAVASVASAPLATTAAPAPVSIADKTTIAAATVQPAPAPVTVPPAPAVERSTAASPIALARTTTAAATALAKPESATISERKATEAGPVVSASTRPDFRVRIPAKNAVPAKLIQRETSRTKHAGTRTERRVEERSVVSRRSVVHHDSHDFNAYRHVAPLVTTQRTNGGYSQAQSYSPRQTGANPANEYASTATYANTYTAPRPVSRTSTAADSTDWVNHVSQRRVTEVPDRFEK